MMVKSRFLSTTLLDSLVVCFDYQLRSAVCLHECIFTGMTALHQAVLDNNLAVVKILINHGSDINQQDEDSWTPLHAACANGAADIAK